MKAFRIFLKLFPFWMFLALFKAAGSFHYAIFPVLGERLFPIWMIGLLVSAEAFAQMLFDVPAGYLLDRFGYVRTLKVSSVCFLIGAGVLFFGIHVWTILTSLFFALIGWLFFGPGVDAYVLVKADKRFAGQFMAMRDVMASAGVILGMIILPLVIHLSDHTPVLIMMGLFLASLIALFQAPTDKMSVHSSQKIGYQSFYIRRKFIHHVIRSLGTLNPVSAMLMLQ